MLDTIGIHLNVKRTEHSYVITLGLNKSLLLVGYSTVLNYLSSYNNTTLKDIEEKFNNFINGVNTHKSFVSNKGKCEFSFSKYHVSELEAINIVTNTFNEVFTQLNDEYLNKIDKDVS